jgi:hypothetical protein
VARQQPLAVVLPPIATTLDAIGAVVATNLARLAEAQKNDENKILTGDESRGLHAQTTALIAAEQARKDFSRLDFGEVSDDRLEAMLREELTALDRRKALK